MQEPCRYVELTPSMQRTEAEAAIVSNNQCARQVRDRYVELQRWLRGRVE
jgi:hypothetical protein